MLKIVQKFFKGHAFLKNIVEYIPLHLFFFIDLKQIITFRTALIGYQLLLNIYYMYQAIKKSFPYSNLSSFLDDQHIISFIKNLVTLTG